MSVTEHASLPALLMLALVSSGAAACRLLAVTARGHPEPAPAQSGRAGGATPAPSGGWRNADPRGTRDAPDQLRSVRLRLNRQDPRSPAYQVNEWIVRFSSDGGLRQELEAGLGRMARYEEMIRARLRHYGMPEELIWVVMVESHFRENAVSRAGAVGMWQFMPETGRSYDLEVSAYVDERRDPLKSTEAAVLHLRDLHAAFASWHLALAAYNGGAGRVERILRREARARGGDERLFWLIRPRLPAETRLYVPKYLAMVEIGRAPGAFGLRPGPRQAALTFDVLWCPGGTSLDSVATSVGAAPGVVRALNPHLVRGVTPPGRRWPVRVPSVAPRASNRPRS